MPADWRTLVSAKSADELLVWFAERASEAGSVISNWNTGGVWRTFLELAAKGLEQLYNTAITVAEQGFPAYAVDGWLDEHLRAVALKRHAESRTGGYLTLMVSQTVTLPAGHPVATHPGADGDVLRYRVEAETTINAPLGVAFIRAVSPGSRFNVAPGRIVVLETPIPGVTAVINGASWITEFGTDREADVAARARISLRWSELSRGSTADAYRSWVLGASEDVIGVRIRDDFPRGPCTVDAIVRSPTGLPSDTLLETVQTYVEALKPLTDDFRAVAPVARPVTRWVELLVHPDTPDLEAVRTQALARWQAQFVYDAALSDDVADADAVPLLQPGEDWRPGAAGAVLMPRQRLESEGARRWVRDCRLWDDAERTVPASTVVVAEDELATLGAVDITVTRLESL